MIYPQKVFNFGENTSLAHEVGNVDCPVCDYCWPKKCRCGGLVHTHKGRDMQRLENENEWVWNEYACDQCGDKYAVIADNPSPNDIWKAKPI